MGVGASTPKPDRYFIMKEIKLGKKDLFTLVDDEDYDYLNQFKWYAKKNRHTYYARRTLCRIGVKEKRITMHREIMGSSGDFQIDHINRNGLDNQRKNLRFCTNGQNQMNRKSSGRSRYLGVYYNQRIYKGRIYEYIRANISVGKKILSLGNFPTEKDAALAYNSAAQKYHGEFANLNIIENERQN